MAQVGSIVNLEMPTSATLRAVAERIIDNAVAEERERIIAKLRAWAKDCKDDAAHLSILQAVGRLERGE